MPASSDQFPFTHDWARSGITLDNSDFSADFRAFSQLDASRTDVEYASLALSILWPRHEIS